MKWLAEHRRALLRDDYARLVSAFRALDVAGRGYLEPDELRAALGAGALSAAEVTDMIRCRFPIGSEPALRAGCALALHARAYSLCSC